MWFCFNYKPFECTILRLISKRTTCLSNFEIPEFKKFLWRPNWTRPTASSNFGCPRYFFHPIIYFQIGHILMVEQISTELDYHLPQGTTTVVVWLEFPLAPGMPADPFSPFCPLTPIPPFGPISPLMPFVPLFPGGHITPLSPLAPDTPVGPVSPFCPLGSALPFGPTGPMMLFPGGPISPLSPLAPGTPVNPLPPLCPFCPAWPFGPTVPILPCLPLFPGNPIIPLSPFFPLLPRFPFSPLGPDGPGGPWGPDWQESPFDWQSCTPASVSSLLILLRVSVVTVALFVSLAKFAWRLTLSW